MENIVFGIRPVIEAIEAGRQIEKVYVRKGADGQLLAELKSVCKVQKVHMQEVPVEKLNRMTRLNHQGVVATIAPIVYADLEEILSNVPEGEAGLIVLLDSITDVRNFGAIARSAECVGAHGVITSLKSSAPVNAEALKSSAGALNMIPVARVGSIRNTLLLANLGACRLQIRGSHAQIMGRNLKSTAGSGAGLFKNQSNILSFAHSVGNTCFFLCLKLCA